MLLSFPASAAELWITNVTVLDMTGTPPRGPVDVEIRDGVIRGLHTPSKRQGLDGTGKFLMPALWDSHVHIARLKPVLPLLFAHGVLNVRDMGSPIDEVIAIRNSAPLRVRTPGPMIDGPPSEQGPFNNLVRSPAGAAAAIVKGSEFVKVQQNLSPESYAALVSEAKKRGLPVEGHVPDAVDIRDAAKSGQRSMEHLTGVLVACSSREEEIRRLMREPVRVIDFGPLGEPGKLTLASYDPVKARELFALLRKQRVWIVPTLAWERGFLFLEETVKRSDLGWRYVPENLRNDAALQRALGRRSPEIRQMYADYWAKAMQVLRDIRSAGVRVLAGTDAGDEFTLPGAGLHRELALLVDAGFSPLEALQSATRNAAEFAGDGKSRGTVEKGKVADLILLDANPLTDIRNSRRIAAVIRDGEVFGKAELDRELSKLLQ